jgi:hypothetical protein
VVPDPRSTRRLTEEELMSATVATGTAISMDSGVSPKRDLLCSELEGEAVILDLSSGVYFGLNVVGARIWELLQAGRDLRSVRDALVAEFDVTPDRCEADLLDIVGRMAADGLVSVG